MKRRTAILISGRGSNMAALIDAAKAADFPAEIGAVDIVLFCVKLWDVESAGEAIKPLVGADTAVIPLQNGIDAAELREQRRARDREHRSSGRRPSWAAWRRSARPLSRPA